MSTKCRRSVGFLDRLGVRLCNRDHDADQGVARAGVAREENTPTDVACSQWSPHAPMSHLPGGRHAIRPAHRPRSAVPGAAARLVDTRKTDAEREARQARGRAMLVELYA